MKCQLEIDKDDELYQVFVPEKLDVPRAKVHIENGQKLVFKVEASDAVAMRTALNSILKIVETYRKVKDEA